MIFMLCYRQYGQKGKNMKVFSKEKYFKVMGKGSYDWLREHGVPEEKCWMNVCDGKTPEEIEKMGYAWDEDWMVEKGERKMKRIFSAKKWEEDNVELKEKCEWLYDLSRVTFVKDADGAEIIDGKITGKSGAEYPLQSNDGVLEVEEAENPTPGSVPYKIVITCDGKTTEAVMKVNGKTVRESFARRNPEDKFDFKIGAEYAFNRLFEKKTEEKRKAKPGERIKIVRENCSHGFYKNGDVLTVLHSDKVGVAVKIKNEDDNFVMWHNEKNTVFVDHDEYVVIYEKKSFEVGDRVIVNGCVRPDSVHLNGKHGKIVSIEQNVFMPDHFPDPQDVANVRLDDGSFRRIFVPRLKHE